MSTSENSTNGPRRLQRSRDDRVIAGVCAGVARYANVDATIVRVAAVALLAFGGFGAFAYLAAWLLVPEQGQTKPLLGRGDQGRGVQVAGIVVLSIVAVATVGAWADFGFVFDGWPLLLLVTGGAVVWFLSERGDPLPESNAGGGVASATPGASATATSAAPGATSSGTGAPGDDDPTLVADPAGGGDGAGDGLPPEDAPQPQPSRPRRDRGSWAVTFFAVGGVCLALGAAAGLEAADVIELGWAGFLALTVVLTGVALVASAFFGGARGLIPVGLLLAVVLGGAVAAGFSLNGGIGERTYRIADGDELRGRYELGVGHLELDLRDIELAPGITHVTTDLDVGMIEIVAPDARFAGEAVDPDRDGRGDGGLDLRRTIVVGSGDRTLEIEAHVGAGAIGVERRDGGDWEWSSAAPGKAPAAAGRRCLGLGFATVQPACEGGRDEA
ncbi:PspC domain-containing protein [Conexibacter stalactiti]|uniref:PspC domain-containing protein n=1 Tax=Conexibacter stalactiti TaxID=1940611 RepID=A0ABU4I0R0_9ACTN|nr:PspC domain-containing protein [Conexibacter stalactiti]MDW5597904.1 PspC domain-containing protein [Conexibacter stalactiti]MEC5038546.1 PspC domain-containing protein [Conexibacter stalactiti]